MITVSDALTFSNVAGALYNVSVHRERKCADTTGSVPVPWAAGHFQC